MAERFAGLPGAELVEKGLADLVAGIESVEALLVAIGAPRLRGLGITIAGQPPEGPELGLFLHLQRAFGLDAHARYNALVRRLVSFEHALELELAAR